MVVYHPQVMARHRSESPDCPFIKNQSDNVPIIMNNESQQRNQQQQPASMDASDGPTTSGQQENQNDQSSTSEAAPQGALEQEISYADDAVAFANPNANDLSRVDTAMPSTSAPYLFCLGSFSFSTIAFKSHNRLRWFKNPPPICLKNRFSPFQSI